ncbi:MAG TPA: hypothetical protein PKD64_18125 [Pirellulaceae bacterium]|nr:hypothetical protein [Pirellulaceae bacterium]HMO94107.1 hypothetical protein [Pirellulaceae bacterium]HMP71034.1 hypothetical protein [Pirellulaceae bacterium]
MIPIDAIESASDFDSTIKFEPIFKSELEKKYIPPVRYSRKRLFSQMYEGKTILFSDYPMKFKRRFGENSRDALVRMLNSGLPKKEKIHIRTGPSRSLRRVTIQETIDKWKNERSIFGVTDLHFRGTKFFDLVDAGSISYFNLLSECSEDVSVLEMLTLVISSKGIFSDSHTDDGDGSNHCFVGKKLWLAWDRCEGRAHGLEDCTVDAVYD